ncbi:MAG TPA: multicopper oxidase domain-containing protein [Rhodoblastus sp.]|nr:multicopper oxidase domain-containing protein [Rhodoblastus sp.]
MVRVKFLALKRILVSLALGVGLAPACSAAELKEPRVLSSENGLLDLLMIAQAGPVDGLTTPALQPTGWFFRVCKRPARGDDCPQDSATSFSYGGFRLALRPGDDLKVRLINHLPAIQPELIDRIHDDPLLALNPTDLHFHGLVTPASANTKIPPAIPQYGDFIYTAIFNYHGGDPAFNPAKYNQTAYNQLHSHNDVVYNAQSAADYDIRLPRKHPSGSFWIHPHVHGISSNQVAMGMSALLTVGDVGDYACWDKDCGRRVEEARVRNIILKDMQVAPGPVALSQEDPSFCETDMPASPQNGFCDGNASFPGGHWFFTLNGQQYPQISMKQPDGEVWRLTNVSASGTYDLVLDNQATKAQNVFQILSVDGVAAYFPDDATAGQVGDVFGNRFVLADCGRLAGPRNLRPVCASEIIMMPSSRVEVAVAYRDAKGDLAEAPKGATAILRSKGLLTGPGGDPYPPVNLAEVVFAPGAIRPHAEPLHVNINSLKDLFGPGGLFVSPNPDAKPRPLPANCAALPRGHHRRIFYANPNVPNAPEGPGTDAYGEDLFGIGYEEVDADGKSVPGSFHAINPFDPAQMLCVPLGPGQTPAIESWELVNLATELHNFHIHQTKFALVTPEEGRLGRPTPNSMASGVMEDNVPLPVAVPGPGSQPMSDPDATSCLMSDYRDGRCKTTPVWVEVPFTQLGEFVFHCHILDHEDGGMMHAIRVVPSPD